MLPVLNVYLASFSHVIVDIFLCSQINIATRSLEFLHRFLVFKKNYLTSSCIIAVLIHYDIIFYDSSKAYLESCQMFNPNLGRGILTPPILFAFPLITPLRNCKSCNPVILQPSVTFYSRHSCLIWYF